jgi:hypothetical protein
MTATPQPPITNDATRPANGGAGFDQGSLAQLRYHVRWSAALAADGHSADSAQHAMLAGALLDVLGGPELEAATMAFDLPEVTAPTSPASSAQRERAVQLGLQMVAHFTSDGRHDLADLYHEATHRIRTGR